MTWFGFKGLASSTSYILNISNKFHDPSEVERKPLSFLKFFYQINMKVVILSGGFGTRISEYTAVIPKPMIKIGGKPIIEHIMEIYSKYGHKDFYLALGYKSEIIKGVFL